MQRCLRVSNVEVRQDWHGARVADEVAVPRATTRGVIAGELRMIASKAFPVSRYTVYPGIFYPPG